MKTVNDKEISICIVNLILSYLNEEQRLRKAVRVQIWPQT